MFRDRTFLLSIVPINRPVSTIPINKIPGIVFADGPRWVTTRRFVLKYLKNFGYNTRFMENYIEEECRALIELRMKDAGQPVPVNTMFQVSIVNILWRLVAGKR